VSYEDLSGDDRMRPWIVNASIGTTAEANRLFNDPDRILAWFKRASTALAIAYAAVKTVLTYRPRQMELTVDRLTWCRGRVHNLGVVKNPHFAGSLRYDSPHEPASGSLFVHRLRAVSVPRLALTLIGLMRGRFMGRTGTNSWEATEATVRSGRPFAIELDGEIIMTRAASFTLLPAALRVCP
jgi:diacylglycerol kinase family enzyme